MTWRVTFYSKKESLALPSGILANLLRIVELIRVFGPDLGRPHTAPPGQEGIARAVFCTVKGKEIVILMTVIKKTNKIPKNQMDTVHKRMQEVQCSGYILIKKPARMQKPPLLNNSPGIRFHESRVKANPPHQLRQNNSAIMALFLSAN